jgi:hypothetical protein
VELDVLGSAGARPADPSGRPPWRVKNAKRGRCARTSDRLAARDSAVLWFERAGVLDGAAPHPRPWSTAGLVMDLVKAK